MGHDPGKEDAFCVSQDSDFLPPWQNGPREKSCCRKNRLPCSPATGGCAPTLGSVSQAPESVSAAGARKGHLRWQDGRAAPGVSWPAWALPLAPA